MIAATEVRASVNMRIGTIQAMQYVSDLFDSFYLQRDFQRNLPYVKTVSEWCRENGKKLCLLANSGCLRFCPGQTFHDNLIAHCIGAAEDRVAEYNPHLCNLCCSICFRHSWIHEKTGMMDMPVFLKLCRELEEISSVKEVFFGGMGEPLFHKGIVEMMEAVPSRLSKKLVTNGNLLTKEMSDRLISAGLSELWISLDGFEASKSEGIQTGTSFETVIRNIEAFNEARKGHAVKLCITFVVSEDNVKELSRIDRFADDFGIDMLNISHQIPGEPVKGGSTEDPEAYGAGLWDLKVPVGKMRRLSEGKFLPVEDQCPFMDQNAVFVKWNGEVVPCMQLLHSCYTYLYEEKRTITGFSYGDLHESSLLGCWSRPDYSHFRKRVKEFYFPFCRHCTGCDDRKENLSDCFLTESPACGACLWASGRVFCP